MSAPRNLLRNLAAHEHGRVSYVELFFDLVFVFAVTQLSHTLLAHFTPFGAVQTLVLMLAVWWVWIYTSWVTNWLDPEKLPVRCGLLGLMLLGLILSASVPMAFESRGLVFAGAYVAMQVGRTLFFLWAVRGEPGMVCNFQRILVWLVVSGLFWMAGAFAEGAARLGFWSVALGLEYISPSLGFCVPGLGRSTTQDWKVEGGHLSERCALFIIIALGESVLDIGETFSELSWTTPTVAAFILAFLGSLAMWWLYFDTNAEAGSHVISQSEDPGRLGRLAYTYIHLLIVAGIIVSAVADELVVAHPLGHSDGRVLVSVFGSAALFLLGNLLFKRAIARRLSRAHLAGLAALLLLLPVAGSFPALVLVGGATLLLIAVAAGERWRSNPSR